MSHEIFFQAYENGMDQPIPTEAIIGCFKPYIKLSDKEWLDLEFDQSNSTTIYIDIESDEISHFMVSRPCKNKRLDECIFNIVKMGNFVSFEPGIPFAIIFKESSREHIPAEMIESFADAGGIKLFHSLELYRRRYECI